MLVTGASKGLGSKLADHFATRNASVIGFSRSPGVLEHANYRHFCVDVRDEQAVRVAFGTIRSEFGKLDVLINNAAIAASQLPSSRRRPRLKMYSRRTFWAASRYVVRLYAS